MNPYVKAKGKADNGDTYRVLEFRDVFYVQVRRQGARSFEVVDGDLDLTMAKQMMKGEIEWLNMQHRQGRRAK